MDKIEFESRMKIIEEKAIKEKIILMKECALSNNKHNVGDVFTDHIGSIIIERVDLSPYYSKMPSCAFAGIILLKDGKPNKNGKNRIAFQCNDIKDQIS